MRPRLRAAGPALLAALAVAAAAEAEPACDPDDGGLRLAEGFCARVFATGLGALRNLAAAPDGTLYAARKDGDAPAGLALRDEDGDGRAERRAGFGPPGPAHGVVVTADRLWLALDERVLRFPRRAGALAPGEPVAAIEGLPPQRAHARKGLALAPGAEGRAGSLFVGVGAPSNACQQQARTPGSPGLDPCPQLERQAGIWRFAADASGQPASAGVRHATGLRHVLALAVHPVTGRLLGAVNGRDQLQTLWGFSAERNAELPAEELVAIEAGDDFGWPYCYHDGLADRKVLAPEYGGDGEQVGRCAAAKRPAYAFPAHWAPMDLAFDAAGRTAYVAFRGSWNRAPLPQQGYRVARLPFVDGAPSGEHDTFAIGAGSDTEFRFTGVTVGADGAVYVAAELAGTIWRIVPHESD